MSTFGFIDIFNNVHVLLIYHGGQIYWWRGGFPDKTTDLLQVADKHYNSKMFHLQHYVIKFVSDLRQVGGFLHQ
jgi:hypothetical protein